MAEQRHEGSKIKFCKPNTFHNFTFHITKHRKHNSQFTNWQLKMLKFKNRFQQFLHFRLDFQEVNFEC